MSFFRVKFSCLIILKTFCLRPLRLIKGRVYPNSGRSWGSFLRNNLGMLDWFVFLVKMNITVKGVVGLRKILNFLGLKLNFLIKFFFCEKFLIIKFILKIFTRRLEAFLVESLAVNWIHHLLQLLYFDWYSFCWVNRTGRSIGNLDLFFWESYRF